MICLAFYTRLPLTVSAAASGADFAGASWASPLVGAVVGALGAMAYTLASAAGLAPTMAAGLALAATLAVTGALHEDGLADTADGFGGGRTRERRLAIMRDSRIGTFGACALILSLGLRVSALASLGDPALVATALIAAHAVGRGALPAFMRYLPRARSEGLSARAGRPPQASALAAGSLGILLLLLGLDFGTALVAMAFVAAVTAALAALCLRQIGGQTGDVLGALEQTIEIVILLVAAARVAS